MSKMIRNSIEIVVEHFQNLLEKCLHTEDENKRVVLVRRLINLVGVIQFLISVQELNSRI
jgi:hypothetical protein